VLVAVVDDEAASERNGCRLLAVEERHAGVWLLRAETDGRCRRR
jgi:hypothetical protein